MGFLKSFAALIFCAAGLKASAQTMSTPYSVYGIGDLEHRTYNHNSGMGYTGLSLKTTLYSSGNNPASLSGLPRSYFVLDASGAAKWVTYKGDAIDETNSANRDFTIKRLELSVGINSFWASGVGFRQLSTVNYSFASTKAIEGTTANYSINYSGDGGINDYYWNNAFRLNKHFSIGVTTSYMSGSINQTETLVDASDSAITSTRGDFYNNAKFDFGAIYTTSLSKKWDAALGVRFANTTKLPATRTLSVTGGSTTLIDDEFITHTRFSLPKTYGAGLSLSGKGGTTFAADYSFQDWASLHIKGSGWSLVNSQRFSIGAEFARFNLAQFTNNIQKKSFQLGAYINNTYLRVQNHQINEYGITGGFSRSMKNGLLYTVSAEGGVRGTIASGLIKENFFQLSFNLSFRDLLYSKGHKYN